MRVLSLNVWLGRLSEELRTFLVTVCDMVDVICLQEVPLNDPKYRTIRDVLLERFQVFESKAAERLEGAILTEVGNVTAISLRIPSAMEAVIFLVGASPLRYDACDRSAVRTRNMLVTRLRLGGRTTYVGNAHGFWSPHSFVDSDERIVQVHRILECAHRRPPFLLCGDLNLYRGTSAYRMLIDGGLIDATAQAHIENTRSPQFDGEAGSPDVMLHTNDLAISNIETYPDVVSDHFALVADVAFADA